MAAIDLSILGDKELERKLRKIGDEKTQMRIARLGLRKSARRIQTETLINLSGRVVKEDTGNLVNAIERQKPTVFKDRQVLVSGVKLPSREELGIDAKDKWYYPTVLEYGSAARNIPAYRPFRKAVDDNREKEIALLGRDIGRAIEREAARQ